MRRCTAVFVCLAWLMCQACTSCRDESAESLPEIDALSAVQLVEIEAPEPLECLEDGLHLEGTLVISADILKTAVTQCESSWIHLDPWGGYEACCGEQCCQWNYDGESGVPGLGEGCVPYEPCSVGLFCASAVSGYACRYAAAGELCTGTVQCEMGLGCGKGDKCVPLQGEEAQPCGEKTECAWPMTCVCLDAASCSCFDGSVGDLCHSASCQSGLYCAANSGPIPMDLCFDGIKGDPCLADWQCNEGLGCAGSINGKPACAALLQQSSPCGQDPLEVCSAGLVCRVVLEDLICAPPGEDGADCTTNDQCAADHHCSSYLQMCWDGKDGDPCQDSGDCTAPYTCTLDALGETRCILSIASGENCESVDGEWVKCAPGTVCKSLATPPVCGPPGQEFQPCFVDGDCEGQLLCIESAGMCLTGTDHSPCQDDSWCQAGWGCHQAILACFDGDAGDPCPSFGCLPGFTCHALDGLCHDGSAGTPCSSTADCVASQCVTLSSGSYCMAFLASGEPCGDGVHPFTACGYGSICVEAHGLCSTGYHGEPCLPGKCCAPNLACHPEEEICYGGATGDPCSEVFPCAPDVECDLESGICVSGLEGSPCDTTEDCAQGLVCETSSGSCSGGLDGNPCALASECAEGHDCIIQIEVCSGAGPGAPCLDDSHCGEALSCKDLGLATNRCVDIRLEGEACGPLFSDFTLCADGLTCNEGLEPAQCAVPGQQGEPCFDDADCDVPYHCSAESGLCIEIGGGGE